MTYHSFRKPTPRTVPWSAANTEDFYKALGVAGTDFDYLARLIPDRDRDQIKVWRGGWAREFPM